MHRSMHMLKFRKQYVQDWSVSLHLMSISKKSEKGKRRKREGRNGGRKEGAEGAEERDEDGREKP